MASFFAPSNHFAAWRKKQEERIRTKTDRGKTALTRAAVLKEEGRSHQEIADILNDEKILTNIGKRWAADNIRKLLNKSS